MPKPRAAVVLDFDGTLTAKKDKTIWDLLNDHLLTPDLQKEYERLGALYRPKYADGTLTLEEEISWAEADFGLYLSAGFRRDLAERILMHLKIRPGVAEFLIELKRRQIPAAIVSFNMAQPIEMVLSNHGLNKLVDRIYAAEFTESNGRFVKVREETIVVSNNKDTFSLEFASHFGVPPERILAVSDSVSDNRLGCLPVNRLGVANDPTDYHRLCAHHDFGQVVLIGDGTFEPAAEWLLKRIDEL